MQSVAAARTVPWVLTATDQGGIIPSLAFLPQTVWWVPSKRVKEVKAVALHQCVALISNGAQIWR